MPLDQEDFKICFHIGYHKTASSWLQFNVFPKCPDICFLNPPGDKYREHFRQQVLFDDDFSFDLEGAGSDFYAEIDKKRKNNQKVILLSEEDLSGHMYNGYNSRRHADRLKSLAPAAKIVIVIRRQQDYVRSAYSFYVKRGGALSPGRWMKDIEIPASQIIGKLNYHKLIEYYFSIFGKENVLVLPYELIKVDKGKSFLDRVHQFLDLGPFAEDIYRKIDSRRVNPGLSSGLSHSLARLTNGVFGGVLPVNAWALSKADQLVLRHIEKWEGDLLGKSVDRFIESNRRTAELIGADLRQFGYPL